jgi:predicted metal-dependent peptidase
MSESDRLDILENVRLEIFLKNTFLGYILQHYPIYIKEDIATAATDGHVIYFGKSFFDKLSREEIIFVLLHELLHIVLEHPLRRGDRDHLKFNIACDIVVNDILKSYGFSHGKLPLIFGLLVKINGCLFSAEEVYDKLKDNPNRKPIDSHDLWSNYDKHAKAKARWILNNGAKKGYSLSNYKELRSFSLSNHQRKINNWKKILANYLLPKVYDYTYQRLDYRFHDILLPDFQLVEPALESIWFLVDVSGSMSDDDLSSVFHVLKDISMQHKNLKCKISFFSTIVTKPKIFDSFKKLNKVFNQIETSYGTSFDVIFKSYEEYFSKEPVKAMIILTDGKARYPEEKSLPKVPIIWMLTSTDSEPPYGIKLWI